MKNKTICFVAGKSGGHIIPCISLSKRKSSAFDLLNYKMEHILFFSTNTPLDKKIISQCNEITWHIELPLSAFNASHLRSYPRIAWHCITALVISFFYLLRHKPTDVITTGGIVAIPVCIAAFILRIPITLYALDAVPGKALKALAPLATTINICFAQTAHLFGRQKCTLAPYPVKFNSADTTLNPHTARTSLNLDPHKKTVLILGGSQGSLFLNTATEKWINNPLFSAVSTQIIHQTGNGDTTDWHAVYKKAGVTAHVFSYSHDIASMYSAADLIICRAGAGTLFEILFFKKQCIVIPLKAATTDHQIDNARAMSNAHPDLFQWIDQEEIEKNPMILFLRVQEILEIKNSFASEHSHSISP